MIYIAFQTNGLQVMLFYRKTTEYSNTYQGFQFPTRQLHKTSYT